MKKQARIEGFVQEIWKWYAVHKRVLPWRDLQVSSETDRAYRVMVSEIMLQQTQVSRVKIVYKEFLGLFPKIQDLASATNSEILLAWRGMGYNSRALRLRDAAKSIVDERRGEFPREMDDLLQVKGVGHYTAAAIRNFAFQLPTPCLDTNIRRILHRVFIGPEYSDGAWQKDDRYLLQLAEEVLEAALADGKHTTADWHAALMDYGSLVCTKRNPKWHICPLTKQGLCKAVGKSLKKNPNPKKQKQEPGRLVGSTYIPNRIFRGKVVEELRDTTEPLSLSDIGKRVCIDWSEEDHSTWLQQIVEKLEKDLLVKKSGERVACYSLA